MLDECLSAADELHRTLARGWNTWDTRSVLRHVLLPAGLGVSLGFAAPDKLVWLNDAFFGSTTLARTAGTKLTSLDRQLPASDTLAVRPGLHAYDGSYTQLAVDLRGARFEVETAADGDDWCAVVRPLQDDPWPRALTVHAGPLWNRPGQVVRDGDRLSAQWPSGATTIHAIGTEFVDPNLPAPTPYLAVRLDRPVVVSAGRRVELAEAERMIAAARQRLVKTHEASGDLRDAHEAMQSCLAWNVIYEPRYCRVVCTVARDWNCHRGGYGVFGWDGFFMARMIGRDDPALGYATALEMFREMVDDSFVPNVAQGTGRRSLDRSQPPVGGAAVLALHEEHPDLSRLRAAWQPLLAWNRWWHRARRNAAGTISPGSNPAQPKVGDPAEFVQPDTAAGAVLETGLDNAPIYDGVPLDPATHLLLAEDVGLTSLYVADCEALAAIAGILHHDAEAAELNARAEEYRQALRALWCEERGIFLNRRLDNGEWSPVVGLTSFYPMLAGAATDQQVDRMLGGYLLNPEQFAGPWMIPTAARDDSSFTEQLYHRGRIWPPMNFLICLGLRRYAREERRAIVDRSVALLVENWRSSRVVGENYSAVDGTAGRGAHSHPLYGWGGLLGYLALIDQA